MLGTCRTTRQILLAGSLLAGLLLLPVTGRAQNRVDLDDMSIKGELLNDNRMRLSSRDQHQISDRVNYRTNFRPEITDGLEIQWPEAEREPAAADAGGGGQ